MTLSLSTEALLEFSSFDIHFKQTWSFQTLGISQTSTLNGASDHINLVVEIHGLLKFLSNSHTLQSIFTMNCFHFCSGLVYFLIFFLFLHYYFFTKYWYIQNHVGFCNPSYFMVKVKSNNVEDFTILFLLRYLTSWA